MRLEKQEFAVLDAEANNNVKLLKFLTKMRYYNTFLPLLLIDK